MLDFVNNTNEKLQDDIMSVCTAVFEAVLSEEGCSEGEATVVLVTDDEIRSLNKLYRQKDAVTDVLSFVSNESEMPYLGDIIISVETAASQAKTLGHSLMREMAFLTAHSTLHLLGYDHMDDESEKEMIEKQKTILDRAGIGR